MLEREEDDEERSAAARPRVRLQSRVTELPVDTRHDRELTVREREPLARPVVDLSAGEPLERRLDSGDRVGGRQQIGDLRLGQVQRHARSLRGLVETSCYESRGGLWTDCDGEGAKTSACDRVIGLEDVNRVARAEGDARARGRAL